MSAVQCKAIRALSLVLSMNCSHPLGDFSFGSQCRFTCRDGYSLNGTEVLSCSSTGFWNGSLPSCKGKSNFGEKLTDMLIVMFTMLTILIQKLGCWLRILLQWKVCQWGLPCWCIQVWEQPLLSFHLSWSDWCCWLWQDLRKEVRTTVMQSTVSHKYCVIVLTAYPHYLWSLQGIHSCLMRQDGETERIQHLNFDAFVPFLQQIIANTAV